MTFEEWWDKQAKDGWIMFVNDEGKDIARVAFEAGRMEGRSKERINARRAEGSRD